MANLSQFLAPRGHAGQPEPRAENREWGNGDATDLLHRVPVCAMTEETHPSGKKSNLALALSQGTSVASWARENKVAMRTAYRWASQPKVRAAVNAYRTMAVDQAVGLMSKTVTRAARGIINLADDAKSESVKLTALRAILSDMMAISNYAGLERRMAQIEEQIHDQTGRTNLPS